LLHLLVVLSLHHLVPLFPHHLVLLPQHLDHPLFLNQTPLLKPELHLDLEHQPELELTPRLKPLFVVTELRMLAKNAKEETAVLTDANTTRQTDLVDSDLQVLLKLALRRDDATDWESADQPSSNKTPRRNASNPLEERVSATSPLENVFKLLSFNFIWTISI